MNDFCFEQERSSWEVTLDFLRPGDSISAARLLALLEGENEYAWEEAFQTLEDRRIALRVGELPKDYGTGEGEKRLRREEMLAASDKLLQNLDEHDPLRLYLEELAQVPAAGDPQLLAQQ